MPPKRKTTRGLRTKAPKGKRQASRRTGPPAAPELLEAARTTSWKLHCAALPAGLDTAHVSAISDIFKSVYLDVGSITKEQRDNVEYTLHANKALSRPEQDDARVLVESVVANPSLIIPLVEYSLSCVLLETGSVETGQHDDSVVVPQGAPSSSPTPLVVPRVTVRIVGLPPTTSYSTLGVQHLGGLVAITGVVVRMSSPMARCVEMPFACSSCKKTKVVPVRGGPLEFPDFCGGRCRGRWTPDVAHAVCEDVQVVRLQEERISDEEAGRVPRTVVVELRGDLMDTLSPGEVVVVLGVVEVLQSTGMKGEGTHTLVVKANNAKMKRRSVRGFLQQQQQQQAAAYNDSEGSVDDSSDGSDGEELEDPYGLGRSPHHSSGSLTQNCTPAETFDNMNSGGAGFSAEEVEAFHAKSREPDWFPCLLNSLCPTIYGRQDIKAALLLALVGGVPRSFMRGDVHVLVVGDPGLGKSQLLRAAAAASPRGVYVCANTSSACGLTITMTREQNTGEMSFEAGAVVLGDGGVTCIDEIDKAVQEHRALLEVMEQQTISVAKAGVVFSLPVHTTVLAAGNPVAGRFNTGKSVAENIQMSSALLSRFDLTFVLRDDGREVDDLLLTKHVLNIHSSRGHQQGHRQRGRPGGNSSGGVSTAYISRFISFARQNCAPQLSPEAKQVLKDAYLDLRSRGGSLPATPRQLQSMMRLAEARAKADLREVVTPEDAEFVVRLMARTAPDDSLYAGSHSGFANDAQANGAGNGKPAKLNQKDAVLQRLKNMYESTGVNSFSAQQVEDVCSEVGCKKAPAMVNQLSEFGLLLMERGRYKLRTV